MESASPKDYRTVLREELASRCGRNPRYSLRAFARDLELAPARLSDVLRGRYGLSREAAGRIAGRLGFTPDERSWFCDLVESEHARARGKRARAEARLRRRVPGKALLTRDAFEAIADWHHYALLELTGIKGAKRDPEWMAERLGVSPHVIRAATERLIRLGLLEETSSGQLRATTGFTASPSGSPSQALRTFHRQILEKALGAVELQTVAERDLSAMVLAFPPSRLKEAGRAIKEFRRQFNERFGASAAGAEVYCLAIQFFRLENGGRKP